MRTLTFKKNYKIKKTRLIFIIVLVCFVLAGIIFAISRFGGGSDGYNDEASFKSYASSYLKDIGSKEVGEEKTKIQYGEHASTAISYPVFKNKAATSAIEKDISATRKFFDQNYKKMGQDKKSALLIGYESYKTPEKVDGVAVRHTIREEDENGKVTMKSKVFTYNFSTKSGMAISSGGVFKGDYIKLSSDDIKAQLKDGSDGTLKDNADKVITDNANHYILTGKGFKFFFNSGTIAPDSKGVLTAEIPYDKLKSAMRDDIGKGRIIDPKKPMVAITYDDGPSAEFTPQILDLYQKEGVVCTFFEVGKNVDHVASSSKLLKRMLSMGCELGSHSYTHPNLFTLSPEKVKEEADKTRKAIEKASGQAPTVFRPPYGNANDKIAKIFDLPTINWSVDTLDWKTRDTQKIIAAVQSQKNLDGQIVLMHSIFKPSLEASKVLVPWLKSQGYQLVTVSELLQYKYNETPQKGKDYGYKFRELKKTSPSKQQ